MCERNFVCANLPRPHAAMRTFTRITFSIIRTLFHDLFPCSIGGHEYITISREHTRGSLGMEAVYAAAVGVCSISMAGIDELAVSARIPL